MPALLFDVTPNIKGVQMVPEILEAVQVGVLSTWRYQRSEDILEALGREASWIHSPSHPQVHW